MKSREKDGREFFAALGHELRTPLNAILGWAHILRSSSLSPADTARAVEVILRNAKLQASVIDDMLDLSRIMTGKLRLSPVTLSATHALNMVFESARPAGTSKGVTLSKEVRASGFVLGDPDRIRQVPLLAGFQMYAPKPIDPPVLLRELSRLWRRGTTSIQHE